MTRLFKTASLLAFSFVAAFHSEQANADLTINVTEGAGGTATFELIGSGTVTSNGSATFMSVGLTGTSTDTFLVPALDGGASQIDDALTSPISLGTASTSRLFYNDFGGIQFPNGATGSGSSNVQSRLGFGGFDSGIANGSSLSDMNGIYTTTLSHADFVVGTYDLEVVFPNGGISDLGTVTLNVVPEPSSLALLGLGGLALMRRRRSMTH